MSSNRIVPLSETPLQTPSTERKEANPWESRSNQPSPTAEQKSTLSTCSLFALTSSNASLIFQYLSAAEGYLEYAYPAYFKSNSSLNTSSFFCEDEDALKIWIRQSKAKLRTSCCNQTYPEAITDFYSYVGGLTIKNLSAETVKTSLLEMFPEWKMKVASPKSNLTSK